MKSAKIFVFVLLVLPFISSIAFAQLSRNTNLASSSPYILYKQGKYREAIRESEILIRKDRQNIGAYAVKGWAHLSLRQWSQALNIARAAYAQMPTDRRIVEILAEAYYELEKYDEALKYFERYLAIAPKGQLKSWVHYFIGMIYLKRGKLSKADISFTAAVEYEKVRGKTPRVQWALALARIKEKRERAKEALQVYRYILSIDSKNTIARKAILRLNA